jgi:phage terminase large subunit-like protein
MKKLPAYIDKAIKCGHKPKDVESWKTKDIEKLTLGESVLRFAQDFLVFPEGKMTGKHLILDSFQCAFVLSVFDAPEHTAKAILSMARRGGKSLVMAVILLAYIVGPLAKQNTVVFSAAMTRDQAGLIHRLMSLILQLSPDLEGLYRVVPSSKKIYGLTKNVEYRALSRDAKSGHGVAYYAGVIDECGQIDAPNDDYLDMLFSSMGTYQDARTFLISTQAPADAAFFSVEIDTAIRETPKGTVCHIYCAENDDLMSKENWYQANPSLYGGYRSLEDIERNAQEAQRIPAKENGFLNLFMNRRVSLQALFVAPSLWKENDGPVDMELFYTGEVHMALDLSKTDDLTAFTASVMDDDGNVHSIPFVFSPLDTLEARASRDRTPYPIWVKQELMIAPHGKTLDYDWLANYMAKATEGMNIVSFSFDRWKLEEFKRAADNYGFAQNATWTPVGMGYKDQSPRLNKLTELLLQNKIRHGSHPLFNMSVAQAIAVSDPSSNIKLDKAKAVTSKIDPLIALVMSVYSCSVNLESEVDIDTLIF